MWYVTLNRAALQVRFSIFTYAFLMDKQYKSRNEKIMIFETKIYGFWMGFETDFKPSILKQDKGVWFSGIEKPENAVRQSVSAFRFVILLRMIWNSYAVRGIFVENQGFWVFSQVLRYDKPIFEKSGNAVSKIWRVGS